MKLPDRLPWAQQLQHHQLLVLQWCQSRLEEFSDNLEWWSCYISFYQSFTILLLHRSKTLFLLHTLNFSIEFLLVLYHFANFECWRGGAQSNKFLASSILVMATRIEYRQKWKLFLYRRHKLYGNPEKTVVTTSTMRFHAWIVIYINPKTFCSRNPQPHPSRISPSQIVGT